MKRELWGREKVYTIAAIAILFFTLFFGCKPEEESNTLKVSKNEIEIPAEGGSDNFIIETNAESWSIDNPSPNWITIPMTSGAGSEASINIKVESRTLTSRVDTLTVFAGNAKPVYIIVSQESSEYLYALSTTRSYAEFNWQSSNLDMSISSEAPEWNLTCDTDWVSFSQESGAEGDVSIKISVISNTSVNERTATITLSGEGAPTTIIPVSQKGSYPSYNTDPMDPDSTGMSSSAVEIASKMKIGWNIGNTLEAIGGETAWGNPMVNEQLIQLVKANGFNAIRIPCAWDIYADQRTVEIKASWLERVKEVVGYCVDNGMYAILNIHWDNGWLEEHCTDGYKELNNAKQKAYWEQIATKLRDFDEHLLFASANEPHVDDASKMSVLLSYHQTFVDAVRSTGGKNSYRTLVVQGPRTDIETTEDLMNAMPTDEIEGRMMAEVHFYSPYNFCLMEDDANWGNRHYYWGEGFHSTTDTEYNANWGEEDFIDEMFGSMKTKFTDKGIPVILGEFGVMKRTYLTGDDLELHLASRAYYYKYLAQQAKANGMIPFYWDTGGIGKHEMTLFNRTSNTVHDQQAIDGLMEGINN